MEKVFDLARQLGEALAASQEYTDMQKTEEAAMQNETVSQKMGEYMECKANVERELSNEEPDHGMIALYSQKMQKTQAELNEIELVQEMTKARQAFSDMMKQVNQVLEFTLTGKIANEGSCAGDCGSCGGCH